MTTSVTIHATERTAFKTCRQYWDFAYIRGLTSLKVSTGPSWFGIGIHYALATYYRDQMLKQVVREPKDIFTTWFYQQFTQDEWNALYIDEQDRLADMLKLGVSMMTDYVPWSQLHDNFEVLGVEVPLRYEVLPGVDLVGSLDLLVRDKRTGKLWVVDHKTCASFIDPEALVFDDQMMTYLWLVWKVYDEIPGGALYSMLRKQVPVEPMVVYGGTALSKAKSIDTTYTKYMEAIVRNGFDPANYQDILTKVSANEFFRREAIVRSRKELELLDNQIKLEAEEMTRSWIPIYPTMTRDCLWACDYRDLCRTRLTGGDVEYTIETQFREQTESDRRNRWLGAPDSIAVEQGVVDGSPR